MNSDVVKMGGHTFLHLNTVGVRCFLLFPFRLILVSQFFVDGCFAHKIYILCEPDEKRDADMATQRIAQWLTGQTSNVLSLPLVLCPGIAPLYLIGANRKWDTIEKKVLDTSAALPAGRALDEVVRNEVSALRELIAMLSRALPPSACQGMSSMFAKMLSWTADKRFPAIDLLSMLALSRDGALLVRPHVARVVELLKGEGSFACVAMW